jgi:predicted MFS family arabinose efflux permease
VVRLLDGRERTRVVIALSGVLALNTADGGMLGALADQLERAFGIGHARFGIVVAVASAAGAIGAPVAGVLADRTNRVRILAVAIVAWGLAMGAGGLSTGYWWLFFSRVALGAALAAATPVVTSLVGDFFHPSERARAYGLILTGELVGAGLGLAAGGVLGSLVSWRTAFFAFAGASLVLAALLTRVLKEPQRGGASWIGEGAHRRTTGAGAEGTPVNASDLFSGEGVHPTQSRVLRDPSAHWSFLRTVRYLLSIPSFRRLVVASVVGYFFFAGLRAFAVVFAMRYYRLAESALTVPLLVIGAAAILATISGGRLADALLRRGKHTARLVVAATGYLFAAIGFAPGLLVTALPLAVAFLAVGAAGLGAANPPLDAARLDIVPGQLWGRAESVRTLTRLAAEAVAPILFGVTADLLGGQHESGTGLRNAFLVMLVPLAINGVLVATCRRTYPTDTVTATASNRAQDKEGR